MSRRDNVLSNLRPLSNAEMVKKTEAFQKQQQDEDKRQIIEVYARDQMTRNIVDSLIADDSEVKLHI